MLMTKWAYSCTQNRCHLAAEFFIPCKRIQEGTRPFGFGGGEGSGHALIIFSMGNLASHIRRPIQQYNI